MAEEDEMTTITTIHIRSGTSADFGQLLELLVKFYTKYEILSVHLGINGEQMREMLKGRLEKFLRKGVCAVAEMDGQIEGVFMGRMAYRDEKCERDYLHLPERSQIIEKICEKLKEDFWDRIPPKFDTACIMEYGIVTSKAQGNGIGDAVLTEACKMCVEKGVHVVVSESLTERTAKWARDHGFVVMNKVNLDQIKDKNGRPYFEGRPEKTSSLCVAFFDDTTAFFKSKM